MLNKQTTKSNTARTVLSFGLSWILMWGGIPAPAIAEAVDEAEAHTEVVADSLVTDEDATGIQTTIDESNEGLEESLSVQDDDAPSIEVTDDDDSENVLNTESADEEELLQEEQIEEEVPEEVEDAVLAAAEEVADAGNTNEGDESGELKTVTLVGAEERVTASPEEYYDMTEEELLNGYAQMRIDNTLPEGPQDPLAMETQSAAQRLSGINKAIYNNLKQQITEIASGTRTNTVLTVPWSVVQSYYTGPWNPGDLNLQTNWDDTSEMMEKAKAAAYAKLGKIDCSAIINALIADCPYELYWFENSIWTRSNYTVSVGYVSRTTDILTSVSFDTSSSLCVQMYVSKDYSSSGKQGTTTMKTGVAKSIATALSTAQSIVTANKGKTPYEMLKAYKDRICSLTSYDMATYTSGNVAYGNPWQLIYVFDGNTSTSVVCEGYAKAFKYLCDLSNLSNVECILATGTMTGGTGQGNHMWNVVKMDDGKNYLVDVTNSDANTMGEPNYLFIAPAVSGSYSNGYSFKTKTASTMTYKYDNQAKNRFDSDALTIAGTAYVAPTPKTSISGASVTFPGSYTYNGKAQLPEPVVTLAGKTLTSGRDYTVAYNPAQPINAGTVKVTVTGIDTYKDTAQGTYTIARKQIAVPTAKSGLKYNATAQQGVADGDGYTLAGTYKATSAGTFTATATLASNYEWKDGTTGAKSIAWSIGYASATVKADNKSKVASEDDPTFTAEVTGLIGSDKLTYTFTRAPGNVAGQTYTITPTGDKTQGNYSVTYKTGTLYVHETPAQDISNATVTITTNPDNLVYTGSSITATFTVKVNGQELVAGTHYTATGATAKDAGTHTITIYGKDTAGLEGGYTGKKTATFTIRRQASVQVPTAVENLIYKGTTQTGVKAGSGYVLSGTYSAINAGSYTATATPDSNHAWIDGSTTAKSISWTIARKPVTVTPQKASKTYGEADPALYATTSGLLGSDKVTYKVTRRAGENAGTYAYTATATTAQGNYQVTCDNSKYSFTINRKQIAVPTAKAGLVYNGSQQKGVAEGTGYTISGNLATNANSSYKAYVIPTDNYAWTGGSTAEKTVSWAIAPANITTGTITLTSASYHYDGATKTPSISVKVGSRTLANGTDYTLSGTTSAAKVGSYSITIKAKGNYTGSVTKTWSISKIAQTITVSPITHSKTYGNAAFNLNAKLSNTELKLAYSSNNTGVATVSSAGLVTIRSAGTAVITISQAGNANYNAAASKTVTVNVAKAGNTLTASAKKASITKKYSPTKAIVTSANVKKSNAIGAVTYSNASTNSIAKTFIVNASNGKVTVPAGTDAGTYTVIVKATAAGDARYNSGYKNISYNIVLTKIKNPMKAKTVKKTTTVAAAKSSALGFTPITVTGAQGKVTYKKLSGSDKLTVGSGGKVTLQKGAPKGTYSAKVQVTAAGTKNYLSLNKTVTVKIKVSK